MEARRALVRPRVLVDAGRGSRCLDAIWSDILAAMPRHIAIVGDGGSGKTTALAHAMTLSRPALRIAWIDDNLAIGERVRDPHITVYTCDEPTVLAKTCILTLLPWGDDEIIEYVLSAAKDVAREVIPLALASDSRGELEGAPGLWGPVLDKLIADPSFPGPLEALKELLRLELADARARRRAASEALAALLRDVKVRRADGERRRGLIAHRPVQLMVAAGVLVEGLTLKKPRWAIPLDSPEDLMRACAAELRGQPNAVQVLADTLRGTNEERHSIAATLLHAAGKLEHPGHLNALNLEKARLAGLAWPGIQIQNLKAAGADLSDAELNTAKLAGANFDGARLSRAQLAYAAIQGASLRQARLVGTDLNFAKAERADFSFADLTEAQLEGVDAEHARFDGTVLTSARLVRANLWQSIIHRCELDGADLSGSNLDDATLQWLDLRGVELVGASFRKTMLSHCDLSGLHLPAVVFEGATFDQVDLTATSMPNACLAGATLLSCGLAEIDWEGADLRNADLHGSTFHAGSSRSGLVFSPIASEGTRTGFYTDDFDAHNHKPPEEVRKANLRGADLRGAKFAGVDFYLVDLRDAQYDPEAVDWFRKCGAILQHRV